jgi:NAD(P)-dependent dehydrogenase (short-subunit alcohol dehydrogenase family)
MTEHSPIAVVSGSDTLVGQTLVSRLSDGGWRVVAVDAPGATRHPDAAKSVQGELWEEAFWDALRTRLAGNASTPVAFVHAVSGFRAIAAEVDVSAGDAFNLTVRAAELGSRHLLPLMPRDRGAIVFLTSVLAEWDTRADAGIFAATQAGLLALARSLAVTGGPAGIRVNAVSMGLVATDVEETPAEVRQRIPLGRPASPTEVFDAVEFLLSPDARHISGSVLVVDGGQSLQSWSNAPREGGYPPSIHTADAPFARPWATQASPASPATTFMVQDHWSTHAAPQRRIPDKVVLITGAAGGLGSAAAWRFAAEGARLALLDHDLAAVARLAEEIAQGDADAIAIAADVTDEGEMAAAFAHAEAHFGRLDVVFNNAGIGGLDLVVAETPADRWDETIAVNLGGVFLGCKLAVPALRRAGGGAIVNMGSSTGRHDTITGGAAYMASKAAVEAMTKSLALQVARYGIRANTIAPGIIETSLSFRQQERGDRASFFAEFAARIPRRQVGQPEDVAAAVSFLASERARHVTGATLLIDGGQTLRRWVSAPDLEVNRKEGLTW